MNYRVNKNFIKENPDFELHCDTDMKCVSSLTVVNNIVDETCDYRIKNKDEVISVVQK
jgi:hypothetical protein